jgi:DNA-binding transcriptional regulator YiaG
MKLSELIKEQMIDRILTVKELSEFMGVSKESVHKWRDGSRNPKGKNRIKLFKLLNINEEDLK